MGPHRSGQQEWTTRIKITSANRPDPYLRVPLSDAALAVLAQMQPRTCQWVFPGQGDKKAISDTSVRNVLRRLGYSEADASAHGFRTTFKTWALETTDFPPHVVEMAIGHVIPAGVERAYRAGQLFEVRRRLDGRLGQLLWPGNEPRKAARIIRCAGGDGVGTLAGPTCAIHSQFAASVGMPWYTAHMRELIRLVWCRLVSLVNLVGGETAGETAGNADGVVVETAAKAGETGKVDKHVAGETAVRSKEAERSASRRAANPEGHRQMHKVYSAKSKAKAKRERDAAALLAMVAKQREEHAALIARLLDDLRAMDAADEAARAAEAEMLHDTASRRSCGAPRAAVPGEGPQGPGPSASGPFLRAGSSSVPRWNPWRPRAARWSSDVWVPG